MGWRLAVLIAVLGLAVLGVAWCFIDPLWLDRPIERAHYPHCGKCHGYPLCWIDPSDDERLSELCLTHKARWKRIRQLEVLELERHDWQADRELPKAPGCPSPKAKREPPESLADPDLITRIYR